MFPCSVLDLTDSSPLCCYSSNYVTAKTSCAVLAHRVCVGAENTVGASKSIILVETSDEGIFKATRPGLFFDFLPIQQFLAEAQSIMQGHGVAERFHILLTGQHRG